MREGRSQHGAEPAWGGASVGRNRGTAHSHTLLHGTAEQPSLPTHGLPPAQSYASPPGNYQRRFVRHMRRMRAMYSPQQVSSPARHAGAKARFT